MADVRSLLRQQQAARRITHPCAIYTESGKLSCILCDELVKTESLWDTHLRSKSHRSRVQARTDASAAPSSAAPKRLLSDSNETVDSDAADAADTDTDEHLAKKRSRPSSLDVEATKGSPAAVASAVPRRMSGAPLPGMEIQIPSRPATPSRSAIPGSAATSAYFEFPTSAPSLEARSVPTTSTPATGAEKDSAVVDEDEWAAFEADIAATTATYSSKATISAPAMTAEEVAQKEVAQKAQEEEFQREPTSKQIEDAKEEAKRQLENEFEEMEELEARVKELKEKREAIRKRAESAAAPPMEAAKPAEQEEDDESSDEDEDDDDWAGFRFKGAEN